MSDKIPAVGSKLMVFRNLAKHTPGGLKKGDLMFRKGRIISRRKHAAGKKAIKHLVALGYKAKKGSFTLFRKSMAQKSRKQGRKQGRKSRKQMRGGWFFGTDNATANSTAKAPTPTPMPNKPAM